MGRSSLDIFPKKTYRWPQIHEKMLSITNHQGGYKWKPQWDITSHLLEWLTKRQEITGVGKVVGEGEPCVLLVGIYIGAATKGNSITRFLRKFKIELPYDLAIPLWVFILRKQKPNLKRDMYPHVHCSIVYNSQDMTTT